MAESRSAPDLYARVLSSREEVTDPYSATSAAAAVLRKRPAFRDLLQQKMSLGSRTMMQVGNLYTAALPAWLAAAFEEAAHAEIDLGEAPMVAVGYGSGDAAEALPIRVTAGWREQAQCIGLAKALSGFIDLNREQYEALHDELHAVDLDYTPKDEFIISHLGSRYEKGFQDLSIEYYEYMS